MRTLTPEAARAILVRESSESFQPVLKITGPGLEPTRAVDNLESITRNGQEYGPWAFDTFTRLGLRLVAADGD